jgi:hypothetical protein
MFGQGEQYKFGLWLGEDKSNELIKLANTTVKMKDFEIQDMIQYFQEKLSVL